MSELRKSGIDVLGEIPWGSHFCNFYETRQDLLEILTSYFKAGIEDHEFCLWVIPWSSDQFTIDEASTILRKAIPDFDHYLSQGSIEIVFAKEWFQGEEVYDLNGVISRFVEKLDKALSRGFNGMRVNGGSEWLLDKESDLATFERMVGELIAGQRMIALCNFPLHGIKGDDVFDIAQTHQFAIARRKGEWKVIEPGIDINAAEGASQKNIAGSASQDHKILEETVLKLRQTNIALHKEIAERRRAEELLRKSEDHLRMVIDTIPALVWCARPDGSVDFINKRHREFTGLSLEDVRDWRWTDLIHPDDRSRLIEFWKEGLTSGKELKTEGRLRRASGDYCWLLFQAVPLRDELGNIRRWYGTKTDITELKQAEEELRRSEDRIRLIIDTIPTMVWSISPNGSIDFVNLRWQEYAGITMEDEMENPTQIIHPDDLTRVMEKWRKNMTAGEFSEDEMRLRRADGEYRWFLVRTSPFRDEKGNIIKWYGVSTDIENSRRAEEELRLAYQRLSYHVENTPLAVIEFDKDLFIKRWSERAEEIFGWSISEALGKNVYDPDFPIIYIGDIPGVDKINEQLMSGQVNRNFSLNRNYTKDGKVIFNEWYNSVLKDEEGSVITILSLVQNVTERKIAEERIKQSEAHLSEAQRVAKLGSWDLDLKSGRLIWSEELFNIFDADKQSFKETHDSFLNFVDKRDRAIVLKTSTRTQKTGEPFTIEYHITTSTGEKRIIQERGYGQKDENDKVIRLFGTAQDITERKKAEETLQQSYEEIKRLTTHLQKIREEERVAIAREIHDELGQQLTAIKMDIAWIDKKIPDENKALKTKLKNIIGLLDGSNQSIRRILSELRSRILDDHNLLEAIEWLCRQFSETTGIPVKLKAPEGTIKIEEQSATSLFRVCQEAFTNITRHAHAKNISVTISIIEENIILTIEDDGKGFDPATVQNKKSFGILGMRERILALSGKFELVSSPGNGTKISVTVPYKG